MKRIFFIIFILTNTVIFCEKVKYSNNSGSITIIQGFKGETFFPCVMTTVNEDDFYRKNYTDDDTLKLKIKGHLDGKNCIEKITLFECSGVVHEKLSCQELAVIIDEINIKKRKMNLEELDTMIKM